MVNDGSIVINVDFDTTPMEKGAKKVESVAKRMENTFKNVAKVAAAAFSIKALADFGKQAIELASDMDEVQNVVDTAFGDLTYQVEAFADTAIEKLGLSKLAAKQMASTYMAMGKGIGVADQASANMAINATARAADIMSFYNLSADRANTMMKAIWTGETESFKAIGVVMTEANLQNFAYTQGINKKISAMTEAERVQLRYNYVMEQTALADGDFAKTSGGWANQVRMLSEKFKEFLSIVGTGLIQVLTPFVQMLNAVMSKLIAFATTLSNVFSALFGKGESQADTQKKIATQTAIAAENEGKLADNAKTAGKATKEAGKEAKKATASFDTLNVLDTSQNTDSGSADEAENSIAAIDTTAMTGGLAEVEAGVESIGGSVDELAGNIKSKIDEIKNYLLTTFSPAIKSVVDNVLPELDRLKGIFKGIFSDVKGWGDPLLTYAKGTLLPAMANIFADIAEVVGGELNTIGTVLGDLWDAVIEPFFAEFIDAGLPMIAKTAEKASKLFTTAFKEIKKIFDAVWTNGIMPGIESGVAIFSSAWESIKKIWKAHGQPIFDGINRAIKNVGGIFYSVWKNYLEPIWKNLMNAIDWLWDKHLKKLWDNILDFVGEVVGCALTIYNNAIAPIANWLSEYLLPIVANVIDTTVNMLGSLAAGVVDVVDGVITELKGIVKFITGVFSGDWKKAWEGIQDIFQGVWDALVGIVKVPINLIIDMINGMINGICTGLNAIIRALNKLSFTVPDWIPGIGGEKFGFNLAEIKPYKIPKLASGAVIPPNREFLAVLGDQKSGTNIEAPLETMVEAFKAASASQEINIRFSGNEGQLLRYLFAGLDTTRKKRGIEFAK